MNEHSEGASHRTDSAFQPMDAQPEAGHVRDDGTIEYKIVEGDVYLDGVLQPKASVVYVQDEEPLTVH